MGDDKNMQMFQKAFKSKESSGFVEAAHLEGLLKGIGVTVDAKDVADAVKHSVGDEGKVNFETFCRIANNFLTEDDPETITNELKEAFRLYDKDGKGFITCQVLRDILKELDSKLSDGDLDDIIDDVDEDGKGKIHFDAFKDLMI